MNQKGLVKAIERVERCKLALEKMKFARTLDEKRQSWVDFIQPPHGFYIVMKQSVKGNPQATLWFGNVEKTRREDELLSYVFQARNLEEHSLENSTQLTPGSLASGIAAPGYSNNVTYNGITINGVFQLNVTSNDGKPVLSRVIAPSATPKDVYDERSGKTYKVPNTFLGEELADTSFDTIAEKALEFIVKCTEEAKGYL